MFSKVITVTPEQAREWLDTLNHRNRPITQSTVDRYAYQIKSGTWKMNGEPIIFGVSKNLLNGQHRLKACVQAGKPFTTLVVHGIEDHAFDTMDDGRKRSLADVFAVQGESNYMVLASGVRFVWLYATGQITSRDLRREKGADTKQMMETTLEKHPGLRKSARYYNMLRARPGGLLLPVSLVVGLHYLFGLIDDPKADEFFDTFQSGLELRDGDPIYLLRQRLIAGHKEASALLRTKAMYFYTVTAWNAFMTGTKIRRMAMVGDLVPEIEGLPKSLMRSLL